MNLTADCTFVDHLTLNKYHNLDSARDRCSSRDGSLDDRTAGNCPWSMVSIYNCM